MNAYQMDEQRFKLLSRYSLLQPSPSEQNYDILFTIFSIPNRNVYLICPKHKPPPIILFINDVHTELSPYFLLLLYALQVFKTQLKIKFLLTNSLIS